MVKWVLVQVRVQVLDRVELRVPTSVRLWLACLKIVFDQVNDQIRIDGERKSEDALSWCARKT